jgi:hypothetical protein
LDQYASKHGSFPPAIVTDERSNPLHSWRTEILPRIERGDLYDAIDHKIAWDAPANRVATSIAINIFQCPGDSGWFSPSESTCNYFAVTGPHTAWPEGRGRPLSEFTDPKSQTILLMEARDRGVPWAKPADLTFDEAIQILTGEVAENMHADGALYSGFLYQTLHKAIPGINIAMADGTVHFLARPLPKDLAVALLTVDSGERDLESQLEEYSNPQLDWAKVYGFGVFIFLSLCPVAFLHRRGQRQKSDAMSHP